MVMYYGISQSLYNIIYTYIHIHIHISLYIYIYMYTRIYIYIYIHIYIYIYIYIHCTYIRATANRAAGRRSRPPDVFEHIDKLIIT